VVVVELVIVDSTSSRLIVQAEGKKVRVVLTSTAVALLALEILMPSVVERGT
jgi:hypothetical protein